MRFLNLFQTLLTCQYTNDMYFWDSPLKKTSNTILISLIAESDKHKSPVRKMALYEKLTIHGDPISNINEPMLTFLRMAITDKTVSADAMTGSTI